MHTLHTVHFAHYARYAHYALYARCTALCKLHTVHYIARQLICFRMQRLQLYKYKNKYKIPTQLKLNFWVFIIVFSNFHKYIYFDQIEFSSQEGLNGQFGIITAMVMRIYVFDTVSVYSFFIFVCILNFLFSFVFCILYLHLYLVLLRWSIQYNYRAGRNGNEN